MNYFVTAQGFPFLGMATTLIGAVVNIVLDPIFIFVFDMDIAGAAVATVIAQLSSCIFVLLTLHSKKMQIPIHLVKPEWEIGKRICKIGFSPFLILATDSVIIIALNAVLQYYGRRISGRYADHGSNDRTELYAFDYLSDAWNYGRITAFDQF